MAGSITRRGANTYRLAVSMGTDDTGKPIRFTKTVHSASRKEVEKELAEFYIECCEAMKHGNPAGDCTVKEFAEIWWSDYVEAFTKVSTRIGYRTAMEYHIIPLFGQIQIEDLKALRIQQWINGLKDKGLSPKTIKNYFSVLNNMLETAIRWDYLKENPCKKVRLPQIKKTEARYYSEEEVKRLLEVLNKVPKEELNYKVAVYIALFGGLRKGEVLGLNEDDYIPERRELRISRTRMLGHKVGPYIDTPKTEKSVRTISVPDEVADVIDDLLDYQKEQKEIWGSKWEGSDALIKGFKGQAMYPQNLQRWFTRLIKKNNLPPLTLHGLRHTHTALLASMTNDIAQISRRLGHSELTTTLNIYTHLFKDNDQALSRDMSNKFFNENSSKTKQSTHDNP